MKRLLAAAVLLSLAPALGRAQTVDLTRSKPIAALAGRNATPAWHQTNIGFYGTDMGFVFKHKDALWFPFGDTLSDASGPINEHIQAPPSNPPGDDALGAICLMSSIYCPAFVPWFTTGDDVDAYVAAHPAPAGRPAWQAQGPPVIFHTYAEGSATKVLPISTYDHFTLLGIDMRPHVPGPGFSNYKSGSQSAAFVTFSGVVARCQDPCPHGANCPAGDGCPAGLKCSTTTGVTFDDLAACNLAACSGPNPLPAPFCPCAPVGGVCYDPKAPIASTPESGAARTLRIGNADPGDPTRFMTKAWVTHKMGLLMAMTTVNNFDKSRSISGSVKNDYRLPTGSPSSNQKVFMWGRPGTGFGMGLAGAYFAFAEMPLYSSNATFAWQPQFFAGLNASGQPTFSPNESDAKLLDLSGVPKTTDEKHDYVGIGLTVRWVDPLKKFVMLYGGRSTFGPDPTNPKGSIMVRFADHPWGPWSPPQPFFEAGDPTATVIGSAPATQYGQNGILFHPRCAAKWGAAQCAPGEPGWVGRGPWPDNTEHFGVLYAPNIIENWSMARSSPVPGVDIYWTVSTFNPYQVVLLRTRVKKP